MSAGNGNGDGYHAVDLDGTLAEYHGWIGMTHIGPPIPAMVQQVRKWLELDEKVVITTNRVNTDQIAQNIAADMGRPATREEIDKALDWVKNTIAEWCLKHVGEELRITCEKGPGMIDIWDDRAVAVERNTGRRKDLQPFKYGPSKAMFEIGQLYEQRNDQYKDNYKVAGKALAAFFPEGMPKDHEVGHLFSLLVVKMSRFVISGFTHEDSIRDAAAYCGMMASILAERKEQQK